LQLRQQFSPLDLLPDYSPSKTFFEAQLRYAEIENDFFYAYFRNMNQSDPDIQAQMLDYLDKITALDHVEEEPFCWVRDVTLLQRDSQQFLEQKMKNPDTATILEDNPDIVSFLQNETLALQSMSTKQIVNLLIDHPRLRFVYGTQIVVSSQGDVIQSRCDLDVKGLDHRDIPAQLELNKAQKDVTKRHPLNRQGDHHRAFIFQDAFHFLDFSEAALAELQYTAISSIAVVSFFGFLFVPHWSAVLYLCPMMCILYADLLGLLHMNGLSLNVITYVIMVVSIGLLVDFIMHILLRFFEVDGKTRKEKIKMTLQTMGTAILLGGISTFLGTIPLFFSESYVFRTVCKSVFSMIMLGVTHGLILLPVLLSIFGANIKIGATRTATTEPTCSTDSDKESGRSTHENDRC
jgi:Niemann-Pick C1 protein